MKMLKASEKQTVAYCIPLWLRDEQVKQSMARIKGRIQPHYDLRTEPIAIVGYGPSLNDTWEQIKPFKYVISCSGSHRFLIERGIVPTWHVVVDPRVKQPELMGPPHQDVEYLIASAAHKTLFDHLEGYNVKLWHVFANDEEAQRILPRNEWALTGGCNIGLRAMTIARFLGFTEQHIFGIDGSEGKTGKHAGTHPIQAKESCQVEYPDGSGTFYLTTPAFLEAARETWHELDMMPDVKATFYGEGLVQAMAQHYTPNPVAKEKAMIGFNKPELISAEYCRLNRQLHEENLAYGVGGSRHAQTVKDLRKIEGVESVLDYGCGKGMLQRELPFPIWEYDPAIPGKDGQPRPADLVICTDVLEHVEREKILLVLQDLSRCTRKLGYFTIHTGPARKTLPDGRNTHLIQKNAAWWKTKLDRFFTVAKIIQKGPELHVVVAPRAA